MGKFDPAAFDDELEHELAKDDDTAVREIWAAGEAVHITREDTPRGYVVRVHPDGREELVRVDREVLAKLLGG